MKKKSSSNAGIFRPRIFLAFNLFAAGALLAAAAFSGISKPSGQPEASAEEAERYMPVPGGESDDLNRMEEDWHNRVTYPTGVFNPEWVRLAAAQDALVTSAVPAGIPATNLNRNNSLLVLDPNSFTSLGPKPLNMTGCSGCFNYTTTEGRVNDIVVDPTTTTDGSIVAYLASVGGGVWKTTNCCSSTTSWTVMTDDPLLSTISIDTLTLDPNNHNTIYAGTGDLNFGSFSMGSQGILKSTDAGATWTLLGASVFGPALNPLPGQFPQYQAVGKVRVDPRNSQNVVAGTKTGLYFSYDAGANWTGPCLTNTFNNMRQDITGLALTDTGTSTRIIAAVGVRGFATTVQNDLNKNGANGIYKGTIPASGCPTDFAPITTNANGWTALNATSGTAYVDPATGNQVGRIDIAVAPSNSNYIYAQLQSITANPNTGCGNTNGCQLGAYRTIDGGVTWTLIPGSQGNLLTNCGGQPGDYPQNWYDQGIAIDPNNPDRAFFDTFEVWFWSNGDAVWNDTTCGYSGATQVVHVDQHALAFVPGSSSILLAGNDGGVHVTKNANAASATTDPTWLNMDTGLNTIEFYSGDISGNFATSAAPQANGGAQDNGSMSATFDGTNVVAKQWQMGKGGDGFYARIDPVGTGTSLRFWQGNNSGALHRCISNCTAAGAAWSSRPIGSSGDQQSFVLPYDLFHGGIPGGDDCGAASTTTGCGHLIAGTTRVWETITGATATNTWYITNNPAGSAAGPNLTKGTLGNRSFINQVKYSPKYQSVAIVGTNDGNVQMGFNLGTGTASQAIWVNVTDNNNVLPNRPILGIALDPTVAAANIPIGYAAVGGFNANTPSTAGHVYRVGCAANCATWLWENKSGNLPDIPVDSIIVNPNFSQQVFAGTDWGLYYTNDITVANPTWFRFDNGLPHSMIWDMQIDRGSTTLSVWTRSRGAYVWPLPSGPITTGTPTPTPTPTATATATATPTATATATPTATATATPTATATATPTATAAASATPTATATATPTATATVTPTATPIATASPTPTATASPSATATSTPSATPTATATATATATPTATPKPAQLLNISTRARVLTGDNLLIGGFIINGFDNKRVLILAKGPSLSSGGTPIPGRMANPTIELHAGNGSLLAGNDDWKDSPERTQIEATGAAPTDDKESAVLRTLAPGNYTAVLAGKGNTTGIAIVEIYDLDAGTTIMANISSRGLVDTGDNVMIGGFIAGSNSGDTQVLIRGLGPSLQGKVPNPLADPILELHDGNGATLETNDNWKDSPNRAQIEATGIPPTHDLESAIIRTVPPSGYTAVLRGNTGTGLALVEVYNIK